MQVKLKMSKKWVPNKQPNKLKQRQKQSSNNTNVEVFDDYSSFDNDYSMNSDERDEPVQQDVELQDELQSFNNRFVDTKYSIKVNIPEASTSYANALQKQDKPTKSEPKQQTKTTKQIEPKLLEDKSNAALVKDYANLLESGKFTDAILLVGSKEFHVHKAILSARSSYFEAMFEHDTKEKRDNRVELTDLSIEVCEELLRYIYVGKVESVGEYAAELFVAADKYQLVILKDLAEQTLIESIDEQTVLKFLLLANTHSAPTLKANCVDYFTEHAKQIVVTEDWDKIVSVRPELLAMLFKNFVLKN